MNGNVKLGRAAARSGEWAQHFSNASCLTLLSLEEFQRATRFRGRPYNKQYYKDGSTYPYQPPLLRKYVCLLCNGNLLF